jgi:hypothetical protein
MKKLQSIIIQIMELTTKIETNYPELYVTLVENPETIPSMKHPDINMTIMEDYLNSLKQILKQYLKTHKRA